MLALLGRGLLALKHGILRLGSTHPGNWLLGANGGTHVMVVTNLPIRHLLTFVPLRQVLVYGNRLLTRAGSSRSLVARHRTTLMVHKKCIELLRGHLSQLFLGCWWETGGYLWSCLHWWLPRNWLSTSRMLSHADRS